MLHRGGAAMRGTEQCVVNSARALIGAGFHVVVARNAPAMDAELRDIGATVAAFDFPEMMWDPPIRTFPLRAMVRQARRLSALLREHGAQVIYASGGLPCQLGVPVARRHGVPLLCHLHHPATGRYYFFWLVRYSTLVVSPSEFTRAQLFGKTGVQGVVVYNGVDTGRFRPGRPDPAKRSALGIPAGRVVVAQVGVLMPHKRPDFLLRAFADAARERPELHLCLIGGGPMEAGLRLLAESLGIADRVSLPGYVDDVASALRDLVDINVCASREEGLGIAMIEGSACGLPGIATDGTGLRETLVDGVSGLLFATDDRPALTRHLVGLAADAGLRERLGAGGRRIAESRFSRDRYASDIVGAVESLIMTPARS